MNFRTRRSVDAEINLTPLIDVVFLLLIFFMVTTTFDRNAELKISLPEADSATLETQTSHIELIIDNKGRYYLNGQEVVNSKPETLFLAMSKNLDGWQDKPALIITADAGVSYQYVVTAMDIAGRLGLSNLSLSTSHHKRKK